MESRRGKLLWFVLPILGLIVLVAAVSVKLASAQPTCTGANSTDFLYLPWNTDDWGDWLGRMNTAFDHDFPDYRGTSKYYSPGQVMRIDLWNGEEARPKVLADNYGYCLQSGTWVRCMNPDGTQISKPPSVWGYRAVTDEYSRVFYDGHDGYDWGLKRLGDESNVNAPIYAAANGVVSKIVYYDPVTQKPLLGNYIEIDHLNGYKTRYGHLKTGTILVTQGQCVGPQTQIATQGTSGNSTGEHLHFTVLHNGNVTDPFGWCYECLGAPPDPLITYNNEQSSNLWNGIYPRSYGKAPTRSDLALAWDAVDMKDVGGADVLDDPTPTPGPSPTPGPTPTPVPTQPPSGWDVKVFSSADECNSAGCNPTTVFYNRTESGSSINESFSDGKPWGIGSSQTWGSKWSQTINFPSGSYIFHVDHNDGARVFVNGQNIVDVWGSSENNTACPARTLNGNTQIVVLWKNNGGDAHLNFWWDTNTASCNPPTTTWNVKFYSDYNECTEWNCNPGSTFFTTNVDGANIWVDIPDGHPWGQGATDQWGSIWHGTINFPDGYYVIHADHDDGLKVFVGSQNIMDVWGSSENNTACPARHFSGNTDMTLIWRNTGGPAHLGFSYSTDQTPCNPTPTPTPPPSAPNVWIDRDVDSKTHVIMGSRTPQLVHYYTYGSTEQIFMPAWTNYSTDGLEFIVPDDWENVLVENTAKPIIGVDHQPEWHNAGDGSNWAVRKFLKLSISSDEFTTITYWHQTLANKPMIKYWINTVETDTSDLWYEINGGESIEARMPREADGLTVDTWINLRIQDDYALSYWKPSGLNGAEKKLIEVSLQDDGSTKVSYNFGSPANVELTRLDQSVEVTNTLWQTDGTNYWFTVPSDAIAWKIDAGPVPDIKWWSSYNWGQSSPVDHWVTEKLIWVYKNSNQQTLVRYMNNVDPSVVPVYYWDGHPTEQVTTTMWYSVPGGIEFIAPSKMESFVLGHGPVPVLTNPTHDEWFPQASDNRWSKRKFLQVYLNWYGQTCLNFVHQQQPPGTAVPSYRYWKGGQQTVLSNWFADNDDGLTVCLEDNIDSFKVDAWIVPQILSSAAGRWKIPNPIDPWVVYSLSHKVFIPLVIR